MERSILWLAKPPLELLAHLKHRRPRAWNLDERVQQAPVVNHAIVANRGDVHARHVELAGVFLAFVAEHVVACREHQRRWQAAQFFGPAACASGIRVFASTAVSSRPWI